VNDVGLRADGFSLFDPGLEIMGKIAAAFFTEEREVAVPSLREGRAHHHGGRGSFESHIRPVDLQLGEVLHPQTVVPEVAAEDLGPHAGERHESAGHPVPNRGREQDGPEFLLGRSPFVREGRGLLGPSNFDGAGHADSVKGQPGLHRFEMGGGRAACLSALFLGRHEFEQRGVEAWLGHPDQRTRHVPREKAEQTKGPSVDVRRDPGAARDVLVPRGEARISEKRADADSAQG
jgi:hypothetical protein